MEKTILRVISIAFISLSLITSKANACGWYEDEDGYRISAFRPLTDILLAYRAFYYTPKLLNGHLPSKQNQDRYTNCEEWKKILGKEIRTEDIFILLYKVKPDMFLLPYKNKKLADTFEGNTFVKQLLLRKNKEWLEYFAFAKKNEFNNQYLGDPWKDSYHQEKGNASNELIDEALLKLKKVKTKIVKERYAYHLIRLYRQTYQNNKSIEAYDKYFANSKNQSILKYWSLLHKAEALYAIGKRAEANYFYSVVFVNSEEKRIRSYKLFDLKYFKESFAFAKNNNEKAGLWAIMAIHNPGPALKEFKEVVANDPQHPAIPILIMREINKLEDWVFTPELTNHGPAFSTDDQFRSWNKNYEEIKKKNRAKDLLYIKELNNFLHTALKQNNNQNFIKLARAHLHLIAKENNEALKLFKSIGTDADKGIQIQKDVELALYYTFEDKITSTKVKEKLAEIFGRMETYGKTSVSVRKQMQSLGRFLSKAFLKNKDVVSAGLLKMKSERYKYAYLSKEKEQSIDYWYSRNFYWKIAFFDSYASPKDIDLLIELLEKKNKSKFESYLCNQTLPKKDDLLDLKGTLQLRQGNLQGASTTFSSMPHDYWKKNYHFKYYLNENPFKLRELYGRLPGFSFNKADILKLLVDLDKEAKTNNEKAAENYLKIGHFFYNASYCGNSWMMLSYSWTVSPRFFIYYGMLAGNIYLENKNFQEVYGKCSLALKYYKKAEALVKNDEQKAMVQFMKHKCSYSQFIWDERLKHWDDRGEKYKPVFVKDLYTKYKNTELFAKIECPLLDAFAKESK